MEGTGFTIYHTVRPSMAQQPQPPPPVLCGHGTHGHHKRRATVTKSPENDNTQNRKLKTVNTKYSTQYIREQPKRKISIWRELRTATMYSSVTVDLYCHIAAYPPGPINSKAINALNVPN